MNNEPGAAPLQASAELRLEPQARNVSAARRFLRELLRDAGRDRWSDAAELALSEVVTNGVLHAHTELRVRVRVLADVVEVEVTDGNPALPTQRRAPDAEATTGRGLELVRAMTQDCGVRQEPPGKAVWFTVGDVVNEQSAEDLLVAWDLDGDWEAEPSSAPVGGAGAGSSGAAPAGAAAEDVREVVLQGLPVQLWMAAREHHQAMLRELVLYLAEHADAVPVLPDLARADEARNAIWGAFLAAMDDARKRGTLRRPLPEGHPSPLPEAPPAVDLRMSVPAGIGPAFGALQDALDIGERLAVADLLLVRPALPEIIALRDWACEQVVAQLAGVAGAPWAGADQSRFTELVNDRSGAALPQWDSSVVTQSDRGVVAADDANRILAISPLLAAAVGWRSEDLVGRRVVALIPPELREAHVAGFSRHLTTGEAHVLGVPLVLPVLHKDGSRLTCSFLVERADTPSTGRPVYLAWIEPVEG